LPRHVGALFDAAQLSTTDGEAYFYKTIIEAQMDSLRRAVFYIPAEPLESVFPYPSPILCTSSPTLVDLRTRALLKYGAALSGIRPVERSIHPSPFYFRCLSIASCTDLPGPFQNGASYDLQPHS
jgi:hypothetical protein